MCIRDSSFVVTTDVGEGDVIIHTWQCNGEGLLSPELTQLPGAEGLTIEFVEATGVTLPPADRLRPGESWSNRYIANATLGEPDAPQMTMVETIEMTHTVTGVEAVSVPAGALPHPVRRATAGNRKIAMSLALIHISPPTTTQPNSYSVFFL